MVSIGRLKQVSHQTSQSQISACLPRQLRKRRATHAAHANDARCRRRQTTPSASLRDWYDSCFAHARPPKESRVIAIKKILVPTDFSDCSSEATRYAIDLARQLGAGIELVYVFEPLQYAVPEGCLAYSPTQIDEAYDELRKSLAQVRATAEDADIRDVTTAILDGYAADAIVERAKAIKADMVVMGTHGRHGLLHTFLGSCAEKVVRWSGCPVLTIRQRRD
jgi:nucleotide-binding universal stress UspA family protein